jgi:hypothetical protein
VSSGFETTGTELIKNLTLSLYYYLKDNVSTTVESVTINTYYDIPQTLEELRDKVPCLVLSFQGIREGGDFALGYGQKVRAEYAIWIYGGGSKSPNICEKIRQLLISEVYDLFNRKTNISFKEFPSQTLKGTMDTGVSIVRIEPTTNELAELYRAKAMVTVETVLV